MKIDKKITFLIGDSGCGKSTHIINEIKNDTENHIRSFLIVPEQQTILSEREIASLLPPTAQRYCEVLSFTRLADKIFREHGGLRCSALSKSDRSLVMYRAICESRDILKEYKIKKGREHSCVALFLEAVNELKSYSVSRGDLEKATQDIENKRLKGRLEDVLNVWAVYERLLGEAYSDPVENILRLSRKLENLDYFKDCNIYIDSFYGFTKSQLDIIYHMMRQGGNVTIALDMPPMASVDSMQYAKIADAKGKLISIAKKAKIPKENIKFTSFDTDYKHKNEAIKYLFDNAWNFAATPLSDYSDVELVEAFDEFEECEYVAAKIKALITSSDEARYKDIAIIMRDANTYKGVIDYALKKFDIPYFFSSSVDVMSMPAVKMIFCALSAISGYRREDILSYIKCGYTDICEDELNDLESYIYRWNIYGRRFTDDDYWTGNPDGYLQKFSDEQRKTHERVLSARKKVLEKLEPLEAVFAKNETTKAVCAAVFSFLTAHNVMEQIQAEIIKVSRQEAYELSQVWNTLIEALDSLVTICSDSVLKPEDFSTVLRYALCERELSSIPTNEDVVFIGNADTMRAKNIKHAFILGVNEGVFPADVEDTGFFTDIDKTTLETCGIDLSSKSDMRADDELFNFKNAIGAPSSSLCVSCLKTNMDGKALQPSLAFIRLKSLLNIEEATKANTLKAIDKIYTRESALEYLTQASTAVGQAARRYFGIDKVVIGDFANDDNQVNEDFAKDYFGKFISLSKTTIESFASCHFKYYCSYVLGLKSSDRIYFKSNDVGVLNHYVIEKFFTLCKNQDFDASRLTLDDIQKMVVEIIDSYVASICSSAKVSKKLERLFSKLKKNLTLYLKNLIDEFAQSDFVPEYFELPLVGDGKSAPYSLKFKVGENATISLNGAVDRVDIYRKGDKTYVRIVDYKSGSQGASLEFLSKGFGLQMFIYLFTICKLGNCEFKNNLLNGTNEIIPAGIMYFPMNMSKKPIQRDVNIEGGELDAIEGLAINDKIARTGFFLDDVEIIALQDKDMNGRFLPDYKKNKGNYISLSKFDEIYDTLVTTVNQVGCELLSGAASANPIKVGKSSPCKYCEHKLICRSRRRIKDEY